MLTNQRIIVDQRKEDWDGIINAHIKMIQVNPIQPLRPLNFKEEKDLLSKYSSQKEKSSISFNAELLPLCSWTY